MKFREMIDAAFEKIKNIDDSYEVIEDSEFKASKVFFKSVKPAMQKIIDELDDVFEEVEIEETRLNDLADEAERTEE